MYEGFGLGKLRPTKLLLELADHSIRLPKGMVDNVLTTVREFIVLINFILSSVEVVVYVKNDKKLFLSCSFLATSNALINCRDTKMKLTFGNMIMELNVFNLQK